MTRAEADALYDKFLSAGHEAFSLREIWLRIFYTGTGPVIFDDEKDAEHTDEHDAQ